MGAILSICQNYKEKQQQQQQPQHSTYNYNINHEDEDKTNNIDKNSNIDNNNNFNNNNNELDEQVNDNNRDSENQEDRIVVRALFNYKAINDNDLSFKKGEKMTIIDTRKSEWWYAKNSDGLVGYIPSNYVVIDDERAETQDWWFDINRREAVKRLMLPNNKIGTFLVRKAADNRSFALSILMETVPESLASTTALCENCIKHYRIKKDENGFFYINKTQHFPNLIELINHYQVDKSGLVCLLTTPCPKELVNVPLKDLEIDRSQVQLKEKLGSGQFGEVFRALINGRQEVAVKTLKSESSMKVEEFRKEAEVMHNLKHPRLVQILGICMQSDPFYIITEYMCKGSLLIYLQSNGKGLDRSHLIDIAAQIADGMSYLELQNPPYIHRDLRAANVLVGDNNVVKVADFGLAKKVEEGFYEGGEGSKFPVKWTAPEGLRFKMFSVKSDVWSYGVLLFEIFSCGKNPYPGLTTQEVKLQVLEGYRLPHPTCHLGPCDDRIYEIMLECWSVDESHRPTFETLLEFFDGILMESNYFVADVD